MLKRLFFKKKAIVEMLFWCINKFDFRFYAKMVSFQTWSCYVYSVKLFKNSNYQKTWKMSECTRKVPFYQKKTSKLPEFGSFTRVLKPRVYMQVEAKGTPVMEYTWINVQQQLYTAYTTIWYGWYAFGAELHVVFIVVVEYF